MHRNDLIGDLLSVPAYQRVGFQGKLEAKHQRQRGFQYTVGRNSNVVVQIFGVFLLICRFLGVVAVLVAHAAEYCETMFVLLRVLRR